MKQKPKVRLQVMIDQYDLQLLEEIDAEHDWQLNYSQILHILIVRYKNYQKVMKLLQEEIEQKSEKQKQLEYELRHKEVKNDKRYRNNSNEFNRNDGNVSFSTVVEPELVQAGELQTSSGNSESGEQTQTKKTRKRTRDKPKTQK